MGHDFAALRVELGLPAAERSAEFPLAVQAEAERIAAIDAVAEADRLDLTELPFVTIDPPGARDLDQAVHIEARPGGGWRVRYAIADLGAVITPGSLIDEEARRRGQTMYLPDAKVPLHPPVLSEGALSLLPHQARRAAVWTIDVAEDGAIGEAKVERALVRSVAQLDYEGVQADVDAGRPHPSIAHLPDLGLARRARRIKDGAIELGIPEQAVEPDHDGWRLLWRHRVPVDGANAEVSLLTGISAARMMLKAKIGILRTLPQPDAKETAEFLTRARAHGVDGTAPGRIIEALHGSNLAHRALMYDATSLLRGASYETFIGDVPDDPGHAGIGAPYAQVTAPLRRLADRFGTEVCLALSAGRQVPDAILAALPTVPDEMKDSDRRASAVDNAVFDQVEAWTVKVGDVYSGVCIRSTDDGATVLLQRPAVIATTESGALAPGRRVVVRVAEVTGRTVRFGVQGE